MLETSHLSQIQILKSRFHEMIDDTIRADRISQVWHPKISKKKTNVNDGRNNYFANLR